MKRSALMSHVVLAAMLLPLLLLVAGCGGGEQRLIQKYFNAARMRDDVTLANIATVSYDARQHGVVQNVRVLEVSDERTRPLRLRELQQAHQEALEADKDFTQRKQTYQNENMDAIDRVLRAERQNAALRGPDAEVQQAWSQWRHETGEHTRQVAATRQQLEAARGAAEVSLFDPRNPVDVSRYDGEMRAKDVTIQATVRSLEGQAETRRMLVTLERALLRDDEGNKVDGRWIITRVQDLGREAEAPTS